MPSGTILSFLIPWCFIYPKLLYILMNLVPPAKPIVSYHLLDASESPMLFNMPNLPASSAVVRCAFHWIDLLQQIGWAHHQWNFQPYRSIYHSLSLQCQLRCSKYEWQRLPNACIIIPHRVLQLMIPTYQKLPLNLIQFCQVMISLTKNQAQSPATSSNILAAKTISSILQQIRAASSTTDTQKSLVF